MTERTNFRVNVSPGSGSAETLVRTGETKGSAMAEGLCDALVSRNSATTKYPYCVALFA